MVNLFFYHKFNENEFNENKYDKLYPSGSASACIYGTPETRKFSSSDSFSKLRLSKKFLVSYYVTSLFTNIPLQETIDIAINLIFNHNPNLNITKKELFLFATSQTHFLFMGFTESKGLNKYLNKPKFYLRYVDDILACFWQGTRFIKQEAS